MNKGIKFLLSLIAIISLAIGATLLIVKYFDVIASVFLDLKERLFNRKDDLLCPCCDDEFDDLDDEDPEDIELGKE
jgi:hypothetical protein